MGDIFMDGLPVDIQIGFLCGLVVTFRTRETNPVMYVSFVYLHVFVCSTFMITLAAFKCFTTHILDVEIKSSFVTLGSVAVCTFKTFLLMNLFCVRLQMIRVSSFKVTLVTGNYFALVNYNFVHFQVVFIVKILLTLITIKFFLPIMSCSFVIFQLIPSCSLESTHIATQF